MMNSTVKNNSNTSAVKTNNKYGITIFLCKTCFKVIPSQQRSGNLANFSILITPSTYIFNSMPKKEDYLPI